MPSDPPSPPSDFSSPPRSSRCPSRREFLAAAGAVAAVPVAGCTDVVPSDGADDDAIEVLVENRTDERAQIAVRVEDADSEPLFSRVLELESGHLVSRGRIEADPATVSAFTSDGAFAVWDYDPDLNIDCHGDGEDIGLTVHPDETIESWYDC